MNILCYDVLCHIFEYVEIGDTFNVRLTSKQFDYITNDNLLWKYYYNRDYSIKNANLNILSKKEAYEKCHEICILKRKLNIDNSITDMLNLQLLDSNNRIVMIIPKEISQLINLRTLYLFNNQIKEIPILRKDL